MFCPKCGTAVASADAPCSGCGAPALTLHPPAAAAAPAARAATASARVELLKSTSKDALAAFRMLAADPVGGLARAYRELGEVKALGVGVAFGVASLLCFVLGGYLMLPPYVRDGVGELIDVSVLFKTLLYGMIPFVSTAGGSFAMRKAFGGQGSLSTDSFLAGAALLPMSLCMLAASILGFEHYKICMVLLVFAASTTITMLFAGYTRIALLSERVAAAGVPVVILVSAWLAKTLASQALPGPGF